MDREDLESFARELLTVIERYEVPDQAETEANRADTLDFPKNGGNLDS